MKLVVDKESLVSVADAIREKGNTTDELEFPNGFVDGINAIESGGGGAEVIELIGNYIESTGEQYIDTEYYPKENTKIVLKYEKTRNLISKGLFGCSWGANGFLVGENDSTNRISFFGIKTNDIAQIDSNFLSGVRTLSVYRSTLTIDDISADSGSGNANQTNSLKLFAPVSSGEYSSFRVYYLRIYEYNETVQDFELVRSFIPSVDENGTVCLYEEITKGYFYNQGSGAFSSGQGYKTTKTFGFEAKDWNAKGFPVKGTIYNMAKIPEKYIIGEHFGNLRAISVKGEAPTEIGANAFIATIRNIYVPWAEGAVANAPWGATNATIHYNTTYDENHNPIV